MSQESPTNSGKPGPVDNDVFRLIANYTYDWESWHAPNGQLLWVNAAVERMTGYSPEECLAADDYPLFLVAETDRSRIEQVLQHAQSSGFGNDVEFQVLHRDGSTLWVAVSWQPIYDDSQRHLGFRTSVRDITDRHHLRERLRLHNLHLEQLVQERTAKIAQLEEQRLKMEKLAALGQMAAGVAHEVNNPLAGIRNAFTLFKTSIAHDDENHELLELIDSEIERISRITHQMYQLYRPSAQAPLAFSLRRTLEEVVVLLQPSAQKFEVEIEILCPNSGGDDTNDLQVVLREGELKQVLLNVVRNAIQASPRDGRIDIVLSPDADRVVVQVIDEGEGIPDDIAAHLFDPFFSTKTGSREGMGLGLSVSRSLVEAMGGTISLQNNETQGACATIVVPRRIEINE